MGIDKRQISGILKLVLGGVFMGKDAIKNLDKQYENMVGGIAYNNKNATIKTITKDYSDFDTLQVCFFSDPHIGSCDFDIKGLVDTLKYANSQENAIIFILGDSLNTAIVGSKSDAYEDILEPQEQLDFFSEVLKIAKGDNEMSKVLKDLKDTGKIVVLHSGNHEDRIRKSVGISTTKLAASVAGVEEAFAPYYASTELILRQPLSKNGKFPIRIVTHHGTGISNIDGTFRLLRNVDNADMCVIGHTHQQSMKFERTICLNDDGEQEYHDVLCLTLPSSGGGTYGAGMALPDTAKQSAVWVAVSSQPSPFAGKISPTGIAYPNITPAFAFFTPTNLDTLDTNIKQKRFGATKRVIRNALKGEKYANAKAEIDKAIGAIIECEEYIRNKVGASITERPMKIPEGYIEYLKAKEGVDLSQNPAQNTDEKAFEGEGM